MVADLTKDLYFLEAGGADRLGVVVLEQGGRPWAPAFSDRASARSMARRAPSGVEVGRSPAGDPRAREEFLLACLLAGAERLVVDPPEGAAATALPAGTSVREALAYVRSLRTGTACL